MLEARCLEVRNVSCRLMVFGSSHFEFLNYMTYTETLGLRYVYRVWWEISLVSSQISINYIFCRSTEYEVWNSCFV